MQLGHDDALGAVNDEGAVVRHQRDFAEEDFLFLDVADAFRPGGRVFGVDGEPDGDLQGRGVGHAAFLALDHVVFQLQPDGVAALVAERNHVLIEGAAVVAKHVARMERIGADGGAAVPAGGAQMVQAFQIAALALPVADGIIDELQFADAAEIGNREYRAENRLQARIFPFVGKQVHLQEALVGILLNLDEVRNRDRSFDFGKINSLGGGTAVLNIHVFFKLLRAEQPKQKELRTAKTPANPEERRSWERPPFNRGAGTGPEPGRRWLREPGRSRQRELLRRAGEATQGTRILNRKCERKTGRKSTRCSCEPTAISVPGSKIHSHQWDQVRLKEEDPNRQSYQSLTPVVNSQLWNRYQAS